MRPTIYGNRNSIGLLANKVVKKLRHMRIEIAEGLSYTVDTTVFFW